MAEEHGEPLADGITHIKGTLFEIRPNAIIVAERPDPKADKPTGYKWANPRYLTADGEANLGRGFDKTEMVPLRESIRDTGLHNPLICRWVSRDGVRTVQLVDGERRLIVVDWLLRKNEKCYDQGTQKWVPAKELYSTLISRVYDAPDDKTALRLAWQENKCRVDFGPEVDVKLVQMAREQGWTDNDILEITGNKQDWLRDIDALIQKLGDDEVTMKAVNDGVIDIPAALTFAEIESKDVRHKALAQATEYAGEDYKKKIQKLERQILKSKEEEEVAKAEKVEAELTGDQEKAQEAGAKEVKAHQDVKAKQQAKEDAKPQVNKKTAREVVRGGGGGGGGNGDKPPAALRAKAIEKSYVLPLEQAIKNGGLDQDKEFLAHPDLLRAMLAVAKGILDGEQEPMKLFRKWGKKFKELIQTEVEE